MATPNSQKPSDAEKRTSKSSGQYARETAIFKKTFDATEGSYDVKSKAAQQAVAKYRQSMLGESTRMKVAQSLAEAAPMPEPEETATDLSRLSDAKIKVWLDKNQNDLRSALVAAFGLEMDDIQWAKILMEFRDPAHREHGGLFSLRDYIHDAAKQKNQKPRVDEATVLKRVLASMSGNKPPQASDLEKAA